MTKRIAVGAFAVLLLLLLWLGWMRLGNSPPPLPPPMAVPPLPIATEARPAPPSKIAAQPIVPSHAPVKRTPKLPAPKRASPTPSRTNPVSSPVPAAPVPRVLVPPTPPPPPELSEWQGNDTAITHSGEVVIRTDRQWIQFWAEHRPHEAAPDVDFTRNMVIGVFAGSRPADQFTISMLDIRPGPDKLTVDYQEKLPPPGTFAVDVTVYPYQIKVIPRTTNSVKFNKLAPINPNR